MSFIFKTTMLLAVLNRDQTCFSMHLHLLGSEEGVENRGRSRRFSTMPEEPSEC